jgi:hypothetical protein
MQTALEPTQHTHKHTHSPLGIVCTIHTIWQSACRDRRRIFVTKRLDDSVLALDWNEPTH